MRTKLIILLTLLVLIIFSGCYITELHAQEMMCTASFSWDKPATVASNGACEVDGIPIPLNTELGYTIKWAETGTESWGNIDVIFTTADQSVTSPTYTFPCFMDIDVSVGAYWPSDTNKTVTCWTDPITMTLLPTDPPGKVINFSKN